MRELEEIFYDMQAYCHAPGCHDVTMCPKNHGECIKKLDLDTAIIWDMAYYAEMHDLSYETESILLALFHPLQLHCDKYKEAHDLGLELIQTYSQKLRDEKKKANRQN